MQQMPLRIATRLQDRFEEAAAEDAEAAAAAEAPRGRGRGRAAGRGRGAAAPRGRARGARAAAAAEDGAEEDVFPEAPNLATIMERQTRAIEALAAVAAAPANNRRGGGGGAPVQPQASAESRMNSFMWLRPPQFDSTDDPLLADD